VKSNRIAHKRARARARREILNFEHGERPVRGRRRVHPKAAEAVKLSKLRATQKLMLTMSRIQEALAAYRVPHR
jgi:hypothetical protein